MHDAKKRWLALGTAAALTLGLGACSSGDGAGGDGLSPLAGAYEGDDVTLTMWGSTPNLTRAVDLFNDSQDAITIDFVEQAGSVQLEQNLRNAVAADGGPDLFDTQTENLNSLASDGIALDLTGALADEEGEYSPVGWEAVTTGGSTYGVPAATIPTFGFADAQVFADAGLEYPETWEDVIEAGKVLNGRGVKVLNLAGEDYTNYVYMAWQAGAEWWSLEGDAWKVDVDSEATAKSADVLQQMIDEDIVSKISYAEYASMMQQYDQGKIAYRTLSTWQTASMQANLTSGLGGWQPTDYPYFEGQEPSNQSFTRAYAVNANAAAPDAAVFAANWLATNSDAIGALADPVAGTGWFPAVADPEPYVELSEPKELIGEFSSDWQPVVDTAVETQSGDWTYGPNAAPAFKELADWWGRALDGQIQVAEIAPHMQTWIEDDLEQSGIAVQK